MARRSSKGFKVFIWIVGIMVGFILLVMIIGAIGDASGRSRLAEIRDESLTFLESHIRKDAGNAVKYFTEAAEFAEDVTVGFSPYLNGETEISSSMTKAILDNLDAIAKVEQGSQMEYYSYAYEYEKGAAAELPEYFNLNKAIKLTCAKALYDLEHGRVDGSLDAIMNVIQAGKLIASGTPVLFDVAIGNSFAALGLRVLDMGLASGEYDERQLDRIDASLMQFEEEWPTVGLSLKGEVCGMAIIFFDALKHPANLLQVGEMLGNSIGDMFRLFVFRLVCWRFFFSPIRMYLSANDAMNGIVEEFNDLEGIPLTWKHWEERSSKYKEFSEHLEATLESNLLLNLTFPSVFGIYNRRLETLTRIRAERLSCAIFAFQRDNRRFPVDLKELESELIYDFNTGKMWEYKNNGDSIILSSPGPDPDGTRDDVSITLTNLGIAQYLKNLRATAGEK